MTDDEQRPPSEPAAEPADASTGAGETAPRPAVPPTAPETELRTFLIADIRGYTNYTEEFGDEAAASLAGRFAALIREVVESRQGYLLELRGDEALAVFASARQALKAANEIQRRQEIDALPRGIGIGLDAGEAIPIEGGFRGSALNLAARLCAQAGPGQVVASEAVIHLAARVDGLAYIDARTLRMKGLDEPVRAVTVVPEGRAPKRRRSGGRGPRLERRGMLAIGGIGLIAVLGVAALVGSNLLGSGTTVTPRPSVAAEPSSSPTPAPSRVPGADAIAVADLPVVAFLDPTSGAVVGQVKGFGDPVDAIFADGAYWVLDLSPRAIHRIDPATRADTLKIPLGFDVSAFAVGGGRVWVAEATTTHVHVFDVTTAREIDMIDVQTSTIFTTAVDGLAYGGDTLWVGHEPNDVSSVDPSDGTVLGGVTTDSFLDLRYTPDGLWARDWGRTVVQIDPGKHTVVGSTDLGGRIGDLEVGGGYAWASLPDTGTIARIDDSMSVTSLPASAGVQSLGFDASTGIVWTGNYVGGSVARIDSVTGQSSTFTLGHGVQTVAAGDGTVLAGIAKGPDEILAALPGAVLRLGTNEDFFITDPAIGAHFEAKQQVDQATCARLLDYPDKDGAAGATLEPSMATAMPEVSADGKTYTFTLRSGSAFAPPSNEPLTADTYRATIERAMDPQLGGDDFAPGYQALNDIRGATAFHGGQTDHIEGISADGDRLTIQLIQPSATFLQRLWLPFFCPVPISTPAVRGGINDPVVARAGPYYIAESVPGAVTVLRRNPNYTGPRTPSFDAIAYVFEPDVGRAVGQVEAGRLDVAGGAGTALDIGGRIDATWGPTSSAASAGDQRLFRGGLIGEDFLVVNPGSQALADPSVRRAIGLALDRPSLAKVDHWDVTDEMSPLTAPRLVLTDRFPLDGPRPDEAKALIAGRQISVKIAWYDCSECRKSADIVKKDLADIGITATIDEVDNPAQFAAGTDSGYDIAVGYAWRLIPDLAEWLDQAFGHGTPYEGSAPADWVPAADTQDVDRILTLTGAEREDAAAALAKKIADDMSFIPLWQGSYSEFLSDRVGCLAFQQPYPFLDLVAACPKDGG